MSKVEQMESELRKLSQAELRQIRGWLDDLIEDELEFAPESNALSSRPSVTWPIRKARVCASLNTTEREPSGRRQRSQGSWHERGSVSDQRDSLNSSASRNSTA